MNIGIDARMYGPTVGGGGLGRYVEQLVGQLAEQTSQNRYVLFVKNSAQATQVEALGFDAVVTNIHWYGLSEQTRLPKIIDSHKLDLIHFPHWNVPLFLKTPFIVTIHDLILIEEPHSAKATTRHPLLYAMKYRVFKSVLKHALLASKKIIAVSNYTKDSILRHYPKVDTKKVQVVYEGITTLPSPPNPPNLSTPSIPYLLYVGNAYPHKNLETLIQAFSRFHKDHPDVQLVLAGGDDVFYKRLKDTYAERDFVVFITRPSDTELSELYRSAALYVFPSRSEGFGLPPLEAMSYGVPVIAANTSSLPEILGEAALYFEPDDTEKLAKLMDQVLKNKLLRDTLINKGHAQTKKYSWTKMSKAIQNVYYTCGKNT
jgi:glycosyltransferase involved in cell wall biosynthesis